MQLNEGEVSSKVLWAIYVPALLISVLLLGTAGGIAYRQHQTELVKQAKMANAAQHKKQMVAVEKMELILPTARDIKGFKMSIVKVSQNELPTTVTLDTESSVASTTNRFDECPESPTVSIDTSVKLIWQIQDGNGTGLAGHCEGDFCEGQINEKHGWDVTLPELPTSVPGECILEQGFYAVTADIGKKTFIVHIPNGAEIGKYKLTFAAGIAYTGSYDPIIQQFQITPPCPTIIIGHS